jgi:hypothetical protein
MINEIVLSSYINNASDILALSNNKKFNKLLSNINLTEVIKIKSHLIHKDNITYLEQLIFNLDMYISFLKDRLNISDQEIRYIVDLTIYSNNNILFNKTYYYDNKNMYLDNFKKMFMSKYLDNYLLLRKYIKIKKYNFEELIFKINKIKNKAHFYFEDINKNLPYYITIIDYLEKTSNM